MKEALEDAVRNAFKEQMQFFYNQWTAEHKKLLLKIDVMEGHLAKCAGSSFATTDGSLNAITHDVLETQDDDPNPIVPGEGNGGLEIGTDELLANQEELATANVDAPEEREEEVENETHELQQIVSNRFKMQITSQMSRLSRSVSRTQSRLERIVESHAFVALTNFVIIANAVFMGYESSSQILYAVDHLGEGPDRNHATVMFWFELVFNAFYTFELGMKLACLGKDFFIGSEAGWNSFDLIVVLSTLFGLVNPNSSGANMAFLRLLRIAKQVLKATRLVLVVQHFRELRVLMLSMARSYVSFLTGMAALFLFMYMVAIVLVQGVASYLVNTPRVDISKTTESSALKFWGSLPSALLTLFQAVSGGGPWRDCLQPLTEAGVFYISLFLLYISVLVFALTKVLTGVFVQQAKEATEHDKASIIESNLRTFFKGIDEDKSGYISKEEFSSHILDTQVNAYFSLLQMSTHDADKLFALIDRENYNKVEIEEFIDGCKRFKGYAKSIDMAALTSQVSDLLVQISIFICYVEERFDIMGQSHHLQRNCKPIPVAERMKSIKSFQPNISQT